MREHVRHSSGKFIFFEVMDFYETASQRTMITPCMKEPSSIQDVSMSKTSHLVKI